MCFRLIFEDSELQLALQFEEHIEERLRTVIGAAEPPEAAERGRKDLARRIVELVTASLEGELLPPSEKQLKYAVAIAQELTLELPPAVLQYRQAMAIFLATHAERYRRRKGYDARSGATQ